MRKVICSLSILLLFTGMSFAQDYGTEKDASTEAFHWPEGKQMALSLSFDDARFSQVDKGIPLLNKHLVTGTFYVSPNAMLERVEDWKKAVHILAGDSTQSSQYGHQTRTDHPFVM